MGDLVPMRPSSPLPTGGDGGHFDGMEARVAALEAHYSHIKEDVSELRKDVRELRSELKTDFRWLLSILISVAAALGGLILGLAGMVAKGFHWL